MSSASASEVQPARTIVADRPRDAAARSALVSVMGAVFFCSGLSSLIYEVVWMRRLALFFGSDVYSAALTLSAFMGGLTLGSLLAARYADRLPRPLVWYGLLEISIGVYAFFFPTLLNVFSGEYRHIYQAFFETAPWRYNGFRIVVAAVTLLIPTTLMGATLPLVVKRFGSRSKVGRYSGFFYSVNTLGALTGVLLVGFVLLPVLGMARSTWTACAINLAIGAGAILLGLNTQEDECGVPEAGGAELVATFDRSLRRAALIAIGLSGMAALALEVVWMRILVQSFCATVYAFAIMLSCFLFGIFYGSRWISKRVDAQRWPPHTFALLELGLGFAVASLAALTYFVPAFFGRLLFHWMHVTTGHFAAAYVVAQFIVSGCLIVVPTLLLGATFPVAVKICTRSDAGVGHGVGAVYAANTIGAVAGALLGGMVLIPAVGTRNSLIVIGAIFTAVGIYLLLADGTEGWTKLRRPALSLVLLFVVSAGVGLAMPQQIVTNLYHYIMWSHPQVIYHGEGVAHNVDIFRSGGITTMTINGGGEADTSYPARRQFILKAHLPLLLHPDTPQDVAVVGLGLGITLSATNRNPNVRHIEVIELTREMVKAQRYLEDVSGGVLHSPKVHVRIDDGRNFMAMTDRSFDMITADPIHPRNTGVGYLYTREYYESIKRRLRPEGVVCQWMPLYEMSKASFDVAFRSFVAVFPNASLWVVGANGLFVATVEPFHMDYRELTRRMQDPVVKADLDSIGIHSTADLLALMWMGPEEIARYVAANPGSGLNTDDNAYLEYHTPFDLAQRWRRLAPRLLPYTALDLRDISSLSPQDAEVVTQAWKHQKEAVAGELGTEAPGPAPALAK